MFLFVDQKRKNVSNLLTYSHGNVVVDKWILVLCGALCQRHIRWNREKRTNAHTEGHTEEHTFGTHDERQQIKVANGERKREIVSP